MMLNLRQITISLIGPSVGGAARNRLLSCRPNYEFVPQEDSDVDHSTRNAFSAFGIGFERG